MIDWHEEFEKDYSKWGNIGRNTLIESCKCKDGVEEKGWCDKCDISEDSAEPMMNYCYPLELEPTDEKKILKVVKETNCSIMHNTKTDEYFLVLCGGGMDLSQDIALAYIILETWLPQDLLRAVNKQPCLSVGGKNYKLLARAIIKQLKMEADHNKGKAKEWKESLRNFCESEKRKKEQKK